MSIGKYSGERRQGGGNQYFHFSFSMCICLLELIFFTPACVVLCFRSVAKTPYTTQQWDLLFPISPHSVSRLWVDKKLEGARQDSWPQLTKGMYHATVLSNESSTGGVRRGDVCSHGMADAWLPRKRLESACQWDVVSKFLFLISLWVQLLFHLSNWCYVNPNWVLACRKAEFLMAKPYIMLLQNGFSSKSRLAMMKTDDGMKLGDINTKEEQSIIQEKLGGFEVCNWNGMKCNRTRARGH